MKLSNTGLSLIKSFEGVRLTAYKAVQTEKYWTIGYGHYGPDVKQNMKITQAQADAYLKSDVARFEKAVNENVKVSLNQNQFDALVSFTYNCGEGALQRSTLLELLNQGKYKEAANQFDLWNKSGGKVLAGLVKRRAKEKELFLKDLPKETKRVSKNTNVKTYQVTKQHNGYATAADAKSKKNKKTTVTEGKYYVFNESQGMINVTTKKGVPGSWINPSETTTKATKPEYYIVRNGENLTKIAKNHKTSVAVIQKLNPSIKNPDLIYPKQKIRIK